MHTTHTVHIRGPQRKVYFSRENQSNPLIPRQRFSLFKSTFMFFFFTEEKKSRGKNTVTAHTESTMLNMQIPHVYEINTGFLQLLFW